MNRRKLGRTDLAVTEISFGTAALGGLYRACSREAAIEVLGAAWDAGIRYFDTAPFYGLGLAERRLGDFLRDKPAEDYVISSKVGRLLSPVPWDAIPDYGYVDALPFRVDYDYGYDAIMRSVESSYARLGLNRIDILYVHDIGVYTHGPEKTAQHKRQLFDGGLKALEELKSSGAIRAYGLGVNEVQICLDVMAQAPLDCILLAGRYTLLDRTAEDRLLDLCREKGTSLVVGGVFNSGILATGAVPGANFDYREAPPEIMEAVRGMEAVARAGGYGLAAAAMRFPLFRPEVATVLIGTAKRSSFERNMRLLDEAIPEAAWSQFDQFTSKQALPDRAVRE